MSVLAFQSLMGFSLSRLLHFALHGILKYVLFQGMHFFHLWLKK